MITTTKTNSLCLSIMLIPPPGLKKMANNFFGVNLNVTMGVGVWRLIAFVQDECIFNQYIFWQKCWTQKKKIMPQKKD